MPSQFQAEKPQDCPVCFESLDNENKTLSCGHWVHTECVIKSKKDCCPLCRQTVKLSLEEQYRLQELQHQEQRDEAPRLILNEEFNRVVSRYIQNYIDMDIDEEYEEPEYEDEEERDDEFLMPSEQYVVTFTASSPFRYEDEAILYDGRLLSVTRSLNRMIIKCAFTSEFETRNFCYDMEQRNDIIPGSVVMKDLTQPESLIQTGRYNSGENLIDF
jgi:hypothetical protein